MLNLKKIIVGSRGSPLARAQVEIFLLFFKNHWEKISLKKVEKKFYQTSGDKFFEKKISLLVIKVYLQKK